MELDQRKCSLGLKGLFPLFSPLDEGFYTCVAGNILGETVSSAYLQEGLHLKTTFELLINFLYFLYALFPDFMIVSSP
jgi:hypothetical protein